MAQVSVTIDNRKYRLACNEGEEARLEQLAAMIDGKIAELRASFGEIGDQRLVVMAALTIADSLAEARDETRSRAGARPRRARALRRGRGAAWTRSARGSRRSPSGWRAARRPEPAAR